MVSVIMTSYNREKYIADSIESVLQQEYKDFEFVIVDDASEDSTWDLIQEFASRDHRIRAFKNKKNVGDYPNRNIAASYATRKYIKYLDSDDILNPGALAHLVETMELYPSTPLGLIGIGMGLKKSQTIVLHPLETFRKIFFQGKIIGCGPSYSIIRADVFFKVGGFSPLRHLSDVGLWLKLLSTHSVCLFDESLVYWRKHDQQEFAIGEKTNYHLHNSFHLYLSALQDDNCPLKNEERCMAVRNVKNRYSRNVLILLLCGKIASATKLFKYTGLTMNDLVKSLSKNRYPVNHLRHDF